VTVTVESKQLWKIWRSHSEVCMCGVSTQQWPSTQNTLFKRTRQSARLNAVMTPVDKKRLNSCVLNLFFWGISASKDLSQKSGNASSATNVKFWKFWRRKKKPRSLKFFINLLIISGPTFWEVVYFTDPLPYQVHLCFSKNMHLYFYIRTHDFAYSYTSVFPIHIHLSSCSYASVF